MVMSKMREEYLHALSERFRDMVLCKQLHRQQHLTLDDIAESLDVSRSDLSYAINRYLGKSFISFINELRIADAIKLLSMPQGKQLRIEDIAWLVGFSERTSFYRVCKKVTGKVPSAWREDDAE